MPKDLINAFYKQSIEGLEEEEIDTIMARYKGTESIYEFLFRAFGFRSTRRNLSRYYDTLYDDMEYHRSTPWSVIGRVSDNIYICPSRRNNNNIYNTINYIESRVYEQFVKKLI